MYYLCVLLIRYEYIKKYLNNDNIVRYVIYIEKKDINNKLILYICYLNDTLLNRYIWSNMIKSYYLSLFLI